MVSLVHRNRRLVALLTLFVAASSASVSQRSFAMPAVDEEQAEIVDKIQREQSANGPHSAGLIDPLTALGLLYEERGEHALATAAFERARGIVRNNFGLRSLDQVPLIEQLMLGEETRGHEATVWYLEEDLLNLVRQNPDDLRTVPVLHKIADKRMEVLRQYDVGEKLPLRLSLGCYYSPGETPPGEVKDCHS